jgi:hemerythrin-like domain-containing protein
VIGGSVALIPLIPMIRGRYLRITTLLKKDHRAATGLLKMLEKTPRTSALVRRSLMNRIHRELINHEMIEDEVLYKVIRNRGFAVAGPQVEEAYREQDRVRDMLNRFDTVEPMSDEFGFRLRELIETVERHAEREETYVFTYIETLLSKEEQEDLGRQYHTAKKRMKGQLTAA